MTKPFVHSFDWEWIDIFFDNERPKGIADAQLHLLAIALHHQYKISNRSPQFKLAHATYKRWHLNRRDMPRYLRYLQEKGILTVEFYPNASPLITLIRKPYQL